MTERKTELLLLTWIFVFSFLSGGMFLFGSYRYSERLFYERTAAVAAAFKGEEETLIEALKEPQESGVQAGKELLRRYGYEGYLPAGTRYPVFAGGCFVFAGGVTAAFFMYLWRKRASQRRRIGGLTEYLRQVETGGDAFSLERKQDLFSNLEDEIYKTVLCLRESRECLAREKEKLADNLADISHQLKTPLTAISVLSELLGRHAAGTKDAALIGKLESQTARMADLTAALLTLSRADAGVLPFEIREVPVSELIDCSVEAVQPLLEAKEQKLHVSEKQTEEETLVLSCDLGWTKEALSNLLKNASEHAPARTKLYIRAWENPVYTGIAVEDEGNGFSAKDLPHLFERFYRGEGSRPDSAGIGLSLAKALIGAQNGEIRAENRKEGGARFLIKFYKHI